MVRPQLDTLPTHAAERGRADVGRGEGMTNCIGIDVGGTTVKGARVSFDGAALESRSVPTPRASAELTAAVVALASQLRDEHTAAVGVASAGIVHGDVVSYAANLPWRDEPVRAQVAAALGLPVVLTHDTACCGGRRVRAADRERRAVRRHRHRDRVRARP